MSEEIDTALSALVTAADSVAKLATGTPTGEAARVTGIVLHGLEGVIHTVNGNDVAQIRAIQATHQAAGASADLNSRLPGLRKDIERIVNGGGYTPAAQVNAIMLAIAGHLR